MYDPKGNGRDKTIEAVEFLEAEPPVHLRGVVHRFLQLRTAAPLSADYRFHALPDACTYAIFDQRDRHVAGITRIHKSSEEFNLGRMFHFANIRFFPGVWRDERAERAYGEVRTAYSGDLPLLDFNRKLIGQDFADQRSILARFVEHLVDRQLVTANPVTEKIFQRLDQIRSVGDLATAAGLSPPSASKGSEANNRFHAARFFESAPLAAIPRWRAVERLCRPVSLHPFVSKGDRLHARSIRKEVRCLKSTIRCKNAPVDDRHSQQPPGVDDVEDERGWMV